MWAQNQRTPATLCSTGIRANPCLLFTQKHLSAPYCVPSLTHVGQVVPAGVTLPGWRAHHNTSILGVQEQPSLHTCGPKAADGHTAALPCGECTSVDCQQASASWGQPEGHITCLLLLKHSLQELIPPTALLSLPSLFTGVPQACQAQSPGSDLCRTCLLGPHLLDPMACSTYRAHLFCSRPGFILEGEGECGSYPTSPAARA